MLRFAPPAARLQCASTSGPDGETGIRKGLKISLVTAFFSEYVDHKARYSAVSRSSSKRSISTRLSSRCHLGAKRPIQLKQARLTRANIGSATSQTSPSGETGRHKGLKAI